MIARERPAPLPSNFQFFLGGHPLPDEASCAGARAALDLLNDLQDNANAAETLCLFLISGGASAMMELPLDTTIPLTDTISFHRELVHSGASITEINCVRKHFSAVKGGRLAMTARGAACFSLLVSDVPPDISMRWLQARRCRIRRRWNSAARFSRDTGYESGSPLPSGNSSTAKTCPDSEAGQLCREVYYLLSSDDLANAARRRAEELGFHVVIDNSCDDWEYRRAAHYLLDRLRELRREHPRVCLISSGEVTVELPSMGVDADGDRHGASGMGGRNQHFGLYAASSLEPSDASTVVLSAGSDGSTVIVRQQAL